MILKIIVCALLTFWASRSQKPLFPSLTYGGLTYWAGSMAQMSGIKTSNLYLISGIGFGLSFFVLWGVSKSANRAFLKWVVALAALLALVIYPIDPVMIKSMKS